jgi:lipopolysaccharide transport system ATP-binding protein
MKENQPIIEVRGASKKYDITHMKGGYVALRDVITNIVRSPFMFLKSKARQAVGLQKKEEFWALRDVSFSINKGEVVGVIGSNGAGKSTLLKILSQITPPTEGEVILRGRVGSLLEVGTGFHPELTGRENIFLNGAILGMKKKEIEKKFDDIVEFAGIEKFLDTPVKHYSSGMYVRLAFSVAAHMEPDILLVDEVLAVGDAEFQKKCLGKMDEITRKDGRTIMFVSHNMGAISELCSRCLLLEKGKIVKSGTPAEVIGFYTAPKETGSEVILENKNREVNVKKIWLENESHEKISKTEMGEDIFLNVEYSVEEEVPNMDITALISKDGVPLLNSFDVDIDESFRYFREQGEYVTRVKLPVSLFKEGSYAVQVRVGTHRNISDPNASIRFEIVNTKMNLQNKSYLSNRPGFLYKELTWETTKRKSG